jgi:hypothetical protein
MNMLAPIAAPSANPVAKPLNKEERLKSEILKALARLDGGAGFKISRGRLRDDLIASGAIEINNRGHMTLSARHIFSRAMLALCRKHGAIAERDCVVWRVGADAERRRAVADAISKERAAAAALAEQCQAAVAKERATVAKTVADLEQRLNLAGERATAAERKLASAIARERRASRAIADLARMFPHHPPAIGHDGEPTFDD